MDALATRHMTSLTDAIAERHRKPDKRTELVDAFDEITALRAFLVDEGRYDDVFARSLWRAVWDDKAPDILRWDTVRDTAKRLQVRSNRLLVIGGGA